MPFRILLIVTFNQAQTIAAPLTIQYQPCKSAFTSQTPAFHIPMNTFTINVPSPMNASITTDTKITIISHRIIKMLLTKAANQ